MTREVKLNKEGRRRYFRMYNVRSVTLGNKVVETAEEARRLGKEKAKESAQRLELKIKI